MRLVTRNRATRTHPGAGSGCHLAVTVAPVELTWP